MGFLLSCQRIGVFSVEGDEPVLGHIRTLTGDVNK